MSIHLLFRKLCEVLLLIESVEQLSKEVTAGEVRLEVGYFLYLKYCQNLKFEKMPFRLRETKSQGIGSCCERRAITYLGQLDILIEPFGEQICHSSNNPSITEFKFENLFELCVSFKFIKIEWRANLFQYLI